MTDTIAGKVIVITGASSGMGEAATRHLGAKSARIVQGARRSEQIEIYAPATSKPGSHEETLYVAASWAPGS